MENIPYVFEMVRIHSGCENVTLTYDEYIKYSLVFENDLSEEEKIRVMKRVKEKSECAGFKKSAR